MPKIKFLSLDGLLEMQANNEKFKLIEVLGKDDFEEGHIPGAINMPLDELESEAKAKDKLDKNETVVVYCSSYTCHASTKAAKMLLGMGFKNVFDFKGSKKAWTDAGLDLEM